MLLTLVVVVFGLTFAAEPAQPSGEVQGAEATTKGLMEAFVGANAAKLTEYFADKVTFAGDLRFLGGESQGQQEVTREQLASAYTRMFDAMGREKWDAIMKGSIPALTRAPKAGEPFSFVKPGDYIYELRQPDRTGMDDVILFVLRPVEGKLKVVGHWADY